MIQLTRLNRVPLLVNAEMIEHVEVTPDTVVSLSTGQKFMVLEPAEEVARRVIEYRRALFACPLGESGSLRAAAPGGAGAETGCGNPADKPA